MTTRVPDFTVGYDRVDKLRDLGISDDVPEDWRDDVEITRSIGSKFVADAGDAALAVRR